MGFADELAQVTEAMRPGPQCTVALVKADMTPADAAEFEAAFHMPGKVTMSMLQAVLRNRGIEMSVNTLGRHRRRQCACPPWEATP